MWHLQKLLKTRGLRQTPTQISVIVAKTLIIIQPPATRRHTHMPQHISASGPGQLSALLKTGPPEVSGLGKGFGFRV